MPEPITVDHDTSTFDSGRSVLDAWLKQEALHNEAQSASRTYVVCDGGTVVGFYCISTGSVERQAAAGNAQCNMPDPIPVMVMGRCAVDVSQQGKGLGKALLKDATLRMLRVAEVAGVKALLVHTLDEKAAKYYAQNGFLGSPIDPFTLMLPLDAARKAIV